MSRFYVFTGTSLVYTKNEPGWWVQTAFKHVQTGEEGSVVVPEIHNQYKIWSKLVNRVLSSKPVRSRSGLTVVSRL